MSASIRSMFGRRLPPIARRDERIAKLSRQVAKLNRRVEELGDENARLEQQLASGELLTRPSFRARIHEERRLRALEVEMRVPSPSVIRHGKFYVYDFARSHGFDVPERHGQWDDPADIAWDELPDLVVIKSAYSTASRGVFPLRRTGAGWEVITHDTVMTTEELTATLGDLAEKGDAKPPFGAEEFLDQDGSGGRLPVDVRALTFYGDVRLVALRRPLQHGNRQTTSWRYVDRSGADVLDQHPSLVVDQTIPVPTALEELCESASRLSVAMRAPFSRIDMYQVGDRAIFGEVTPRPGGPQWFGREVDVKLGEAWERALIRLARDVGGGMSPEPEFGPVQDTEHR
jgi:hypothetical protein